MDASVLERKGVLASIVRILVVDDEEEYLRRADDILSLPGLVEVSTHDTVGAVNEIYDTEREYQVAILDVSFRSKHKYNRLRKIVWEKWPLCRVVVFSATPANAQLDGAFAQVQKVKFDKRPVLLREAMLDALREFRKVDGREIDLDGIEPAYKNRDRHLFISRLIGRLLADSLSLVRGLTRLDPRPALMRGVASLRKTDVCVVEGRMEDPDRVGDEVEVTLLETLLDGSLEPLRYLIPRSLFVQSDLLHPGAGFRVVSYRRGGRFIFKITRTKIDRSEVEALRSSPALFELELEQERMLRNIFPQSDATQR